MKILSTLLVTVPAVTSLHADELRIYAVADTQLRADAIAQAGVSEPAPT